MTAGRATQPQFFIIFLVACALMLPRISAGQSESPNGFYQKDFAGAPKVGGEAMVAPEKARGVSNTPASAQGQSVPNNNKAEKPLTPLRAVGKTGEAKAILTLYVSSQSRGHFESAVRKAFRLAESNRNVRLGGIYHIGDYRNVSPSIQSDAKAKGVLLLGMQQVPAMWGVKDSPAWILRDSTGEHIIEGLLNIERCVSPQGEYREPEASIFEAAATPTMGVKNF